MNDSKAYAVTRIRTLRDQRDAIHYCTLECKDQRLGCACDCNIRRRFKIPPFGDKWPSCENQAGGGRR